MQITKLERKTASKVRKNKETAIKREVKYKTT
jgi:hypothetical protein